MATRTPLILNQDTARVEELAAADTLAGTLIEGYGGRNLLINGDFRYWQRATTSPASATRRYVADRWETWSIGSSTQVDAMAINDGSLDPPARYAKRVIVNSVAGSGNIAFVRQHIEDVRTSSGKNVTFSVRIFSQAVSQVSVNIAQNFGVNGSAAVNTTAQKFSLVAGWQTITATFAIPSVSGKTIGASNSLILQIWFDAGSDYNTVTASLGQRSGTYWIANAQLENGSLATPFDTRPDALELLMCRRYFRKSYDLDVAPGSNSGQGLFVILLQTLANASYSSGIQIAFDSPMRATPAVTIYPKYGGSGGFMTDDAASSQRAATVAGAGQCGFYVFASTVASNQINLQGHWTADAEL
ncbi:hypothetical protein [Stenotrophomonas maltophilia]|jgi:hypothetical protein|uniref:Uncharacterized protein n=1 Tax=Stenotrophomonas maltophilia TaxID=40324 RepID=A0A2J0U9E4_STEMA|nr:hypothetical protein [Stenotrophomonas maltophilia]PJL25942.1 hypothetical protein B9Y64_15575 [Stenotrophomonas maltophilia]TGW16849.1 hypothetical protein E4417_16615 [Stenotrophomonas maltophilia]